jgi:hypothetical protein
VISTGAGCTPVCVVDRRSRSGSEPCWSLCIGSGAAVPLPMPTDAGRLTRSIDSRRCYRTQRAMTEPDDASMTARD